MGGNPYMSTLTVTDSATTIGCKCVTSCTKMRKLGNPVAAEIGSADAGYFHFINIYQLLACQPEKVSVAYSGAIR